MQYSIVCSMVRAEAPQNTRFQDCIDASNACAESCEFCATPCLREQDVKVLVKCNQLVRECAIMCYVASKLMSLNKEHIREICDACAEECDECAQECENIRAWIIAKNVYKYVEVVLKYFVRTLNSLEIVMLQKS